LAGDLTFRYRDGELYCEDVPAERIAAECGTPCYVYSKAALLARYGCISDAFAAFDPVVCFSVKCCGNLSVLRVLAEAGSGFDIVSGGELYRVLAAGGDPAGIVYAGVGKTGEEIEHALRTGILLFDVESRSELDCINAVAGRLGRRGRAALRVNPDVDAGTHEKTATGKGETKFGIGMGEAEDLFRCAPRWPHVELCGVHMHLGSPIYSTEPYERALGRVLGLVERLSEAGVGLRYINMGGGYCISYTGEDVIGPRDYAAAAKSYLEKSGCAVIIEPGRYIAGNSGVLLTRVVRRKEAEYGKRFLVCDAAMNDLIRPTLYDAFHRIWPVRSPAGMPEVMRPDEQGCDGFETEVVDVVGPVCETGDYLARGRPLPPTRAGDLLAVFSAGAYGFAMSSNYNARPRAAEAMVDGGSWRVVRRRETYEDLVRHELDPA